MLLGHVGACRRPPCRSMPAAQLQGYMPSRGLLLLPMGVACMFSRRGAAHCTHVRPHLAFSQVSLC